MNRKLVSEFEVFIKELALLAKSEILPHYLASDLAVDSKSDNSPVTIADRNAEQSMRDLINRRYPAHGIIGEEFGNCNPEAEFVWVLDPIDGTISFVAGVPLFGTLISLLYQGNPVIGAIYQPVLNQLVIGGATGTFFNDRQLKFRSVLGLDQALLLTTDIENIRKYQSYSRFEKLCRQVRYTRTWGDCYGYLLLANGKAEIMLDPIMNSWDLLPIIPIIKGAGGKITAWDGSDPCKASSCIAASLDLHPQVLDILNN